MLKSYYFYKVSSANNFNGELRVRVPSNRLGSIGSSVGRAIVNIIEAFYQSVAQLGLRRVLWEHEFAGSNPVTLTIIQNYE